jgi:hypothetical protein
MKVTPNKLIAVVVAVIYLATSIAVAGWDIEGVAVVCLLLSMPLVFIWFPDVVHNYVGRANSRVTTETPELMVTMVGWLWLVGYLPLLAYLLSR